MSQNCQRDLMAETMKMDARDGCNEIKRFSYEMTSRLSDYVGFHVRITSRNRFF